MGIADLDTKIIIGLFVGLFCLGFLIGLGVGYWVYTPASATGNGTPPQKILADSLPPPKATSESTTATPITDIAQEIANPTVIRAGTELDEKGPLTLDIDKIVP